MRKTSDLIVHHAAELGKAAALGDSQHLIAEAQLAVSALRLSMNNPLENELRELLLSIAEELVASQHPEEAPTARKGQLKLYEELLHHVNTMAQLLPE